MLTVLPFCPLVSFHNALWLFSYPGILRRDWQPVGPLHNRQAADKGRTVVHFLVLAGDVCFEFSRSPCGLTQGWWEFESSVSDQLSPRQAMHAVVSFSSLSAMERVGEGGTKRQREWERERDRAREWMCWNVTHVPKIPDSSHHPNTPLLNPGKLSWTDSDFKTQTCSGGIEWVTAEKQINSPKRQDSLQDSNAFSFSFYLSLPNLQLTHLNHLFSDLHFTALCPAFCLLLTAQALPVRVTLLNSYHKQMFGPQCKGKSWPSVQERLMGVLKDSCFHQLGEPEVNGDPHEELILFPLTAPPLSHLSYSTPLVYDPPLSPPPTLSFI